MSRHRASVTALILLSASAAGCASTSAFKNAVQTWASGPGYHGAVQRIQQDTQMDDTSRRIELMNLSGLQCTLDEDQKKSAATNPSAACKCSEPAQGGDQQAQDCKSWADSLK
jgi:hypothetical protein